MRPERAGFVRERCGAGLLPVVEKRAGIPLGAADVFLNVRGGMRVMEPVTDLGAAPAVGRLQAMPTAGETGCADGVC